MLGVNKLNLATLSVVFLVHYVPNLLYGIGKKTASFYVLYMYTAVIQSRHADKLHTCSTITHSGKFEQISFTVGQYLLLNQHLA